MKLNKKFTIKNYKGVSFSLPPLIRCFNTNEKLHFRIKFNESYIYDFGNTDFLNLEQFDFNKLIGFKLNFFKPMKNSIMLGSRFVNNELQISYYVHDTNGINYFNETPLLTLTKEDIINKNYINILFDFKNNNIIIKSNEKTTSLNILETIPEMEQTLIKFKNKKVWLITHWFGGTQKPPHKITLELSRLDPDLF